MLDRLPRQGDEGFTLVETLAAMVVFALLAASVGGVIINTFDLTKSNTSRVAAANLATQQIERTRALRALDVPDGMSVVSPKPVVNGVEYTVTQTANYVSSGSGTSLCGGTSTSSSTLAYRLVTVVVTWPNMGRVQPVRQDTLLSLGIGFNGTAADKGTGAIAVVGESGQPVPGVTVTLSPSGVHRVTGIDGCAVYTGLQPGTSYTATAAQPGYVTPPGNPTATSAAFTVTANGVTRVPVTYQRAGALAATLVAPGGLAPPATLELTFSSSNFPTPERIFADCSIVATSPQGCVTGQPRTASALFPGQYGVWPGSCSDAKPSSVVTAAVTPEQSVSVSLPLAGVRVEVRDALGQPLSGKTVYALHAADTGCLSGTIWPLSPAGGSTQSLALPPGTWSFSFSPTLGTGGTPVTLTAGAVTSLVMVGS